MSFFRFVANYKGVPNYDDGISSSVSGLARKTVLGLLTMSFVLFFLGALVLRFPIIVGVIVAAFLFLGSITCLSFAIKVGLFQRKVKEQFGRRVVIDPDDVFDN